MKTKDPILWLVETAKSFLDPRVETIPFGHGQRHPKNRRRARAPRQDARSRRREQLPAQFVRGHAPREAVVVLRRLEPRPAGVAGHGRDPPQSAFSARQDFPRVDDELVAHQPPAAGAENTQPDEAGGAVRRRDRRLRGQPLDVVPDHASSTVLVDRGRSLKLSPAWQHGSAQGDMCRYCEERSRQGSREVHLRRTDLRLSSPANTSSMVQEQEVGLLAHMGDRLCSTTKLPTSHSMHCRKSMRICCYVKINIRHRGKLDAYDCKMPLGEEQDSYTCSWRNHAVVAPTLLLAESLEQLLLLSLNKSPEGHRMKECRAGR